MTYNVLSETLNSTIHHQFSSDFGQTWYEWYDGKGLQSYTADFEYDANQVKFARKT